MGRLLQVRVSAWTFDEKAVAKEWPALCNLVWEDGTFSTPKRGVMELAEAVHTACQAGLVSDEQVAALEGSAGDAYRALEALKQLLADWKPSEADKQTYALEDALDRLEDIAAKF